MGYSNIFVCLMGMGTVFFGLVCLVALTSLIGRIFGKRQNEAPADPNPVPAPIPAAPVQEEVAAPAPIPAAPVQEEETIPAPVPAEPIDGAVVAAVSAAIAEDLGIDVTGLRITSMKKLFDVEVIAAVSAAIAEELGVDVTNIRITSMKKL